MHDFDTAASTLRARRCIRQRMYHEVYAEPRPFSPQPTPGSTLSTARNDGHVVSQSIPKQNLNQRIEAHSAQQRTSSRPLARSLPGPSQQPRKRVKRPASQGPRRPIRSLPQTSRRPTQASGAARCDWQPQNDALNEKCMQKSRLRRRRAYWRVCKFTDYS